MQGWSLEKYCQYIVTYFLLHYFILYLHIFDNQLFENYTNDVSFVVKLIIDLQNLENVTHQSL